MSELPEKFDDDTDGGTPTPVPGQPIDFGRPSIESGYGVQVDEAETENDGDRATYKPQNGGQYLALVKSAGAPSKARTKPGATAIDIRTPEAIAAYRAQMAALAAKYAGQQGSAVPATPMVQPRSNGVTSPWSVSPPPRESKFARNLIAGGAIALAAVGGVGAWISIGSSAADSTPTAVATATSAQASAVLDAGIAAPAPATSASAKTLNASVNGKNK